MPIEEEEEEEEEGGGGGGGGGMVSIFNDVYKNLKKQAMYV